MKFVEGPKTIRIEKNSGTIILLAGVQGSGKSYFSKDHFDNTCIIANDNIFLQNFKRSSFTDLTATADYDKIYHKTQLTFNDMVEGYHKIRPYTVIDSIGYKCKDWIQLIKELRTVYDKVIILIFQPPLQIIKKQFEEREKNNNSRVKGMKPTDLNLLFFSWNYLEQEIRNKTAGKDADITYIIRNPKKVKIIIK